MHGPNHATCVDPLCACHIPQPARFRIPMFPFLPIASIAVNTFLLGQMGADSYKVRPMRSVSLLTVQLRFMVLRHPVLLFLPLASTAVICREQQSVCLHEVVTQGSMRAGCNDSMHVFGGLGKTDDCLHDYSQRSHAGK